MPGSITNLVFQGGSVKLIAYLGAISVLEKQIDMHKVKRVSGTSAGAITSLFLALGCESKHLEIYLEQFDFRKVLDDPPGGINTSDKLLESVDKSEEGHGTFFSKVPVKTEKLPIAYRLINQFGIYNGNYIRTWVEKLVSDRVKLQTKDQYDGKNLTFRELHNLVEIYPEKFRDLYIVGLNVNLGKKMIFCYDNPETADVIIADAIQISMSIPGLFKPHYVYKKIQSERLCDPRRDFWVDGGLFENYPIRCFDHPKYASQPLYSESMSSIYFNPETLGFRLVSSELKDYFEGLSDAPGKELNNIMSYSKALLKSILSKQNDDHDLVPEDKLRTIYIDHLGISTFAFNLNSYQQRALILSGQHATEIHLLGKSDVVVPKEIPNNTGPDLLPKGMEMRCNLL